ncbi:hypothetical protein OE88DRAFT_1594699, partial [Heliocybe sulcata]
PDTNIIEALWDHLKRKLREHDPQLASLDELWAIVQEEWYRIDRAVIDKLYASLPNWVAALKRAKGGHTEY